MDGGLFLAKREEAIEATVPMRSVTDDFSNVVCMHPVTKVDVLEFSKQLMVEVLSQFTGFPQVQCKQQVFSEAAHCPNCV